MRTASKRGPSPIFDVRKSTIISEGVKVGIQHLN